MKQLLFFQRAAELEHMTRAAEQLAVAQPFLSKTIAALEEELGVPLFDHVGRKVRINQYGAAFYQRVHRVHRVLLELEDAQKELHDMTTLREREVSIVTNTSLYMPGLLSHFKRQLPGAQFHQASARRFRILKLLRSGEADFAVCSPPLCEDPELEREDFISAIPGYGIRDLAEGFFAAAGIHPKIIAESTDTSSLPNYIKNGVGIAFSPLSALLQNPLLQGRYIRYIEISDPPCIGTVGLTWKKGHYLTPAGEAFRTFAPQYFASIDPRAR